MIRCGLTVAAMGSKSLKEYLKRYESNDDEEKKKKKKKKKKAKPDAPGVLVVDEDPVWQKPVQLEEEEDNNSPDEEKPQVDEDIEVKRMKRLEQLRSRRPYNAIAEDGSGWVSLSPKHANPVDPTSHISPPRKQRTRNDTPSPDPPLHSVDPTSDISPPRRLRTWNDTPPPEPHGKPLHSIDPNPDISPPRRRRTRNDTPSPEPHGKPLYSVDPNSDISPPRRQRNRNDTPSPDPQGMPLHSGREDIDLSPPRLRERRQHIRSPKPETMRAHFKDSSSDLFLPRKRRSQNDTPSPESKPSRENKRSSHFIGQNSYISPPHGHSAQTSDDFDRRKSDISLPPRDRGSSPQQDDAFASPGSDLSPPRKNRKESSNLASSKERQKTGLITGHDMREEISKTKKNDLMRFEQMDPSMSGRGAEPVYRDTKTGQRISKDEYMKPNQKVEEKPKEKNLEWGKGLAQKREAEGRLQELELEKNKPFARTRDDPELDKMMKERLRWGDPMAHLVKKKHSEPILADLGDNEKMKESGFIIPQDIPSHSWIKRGLDAAPNRYGIKPGRHWDGVDRSNGFEKQFFKRLNEKHATEKEAYLWSVSDM